MSFEQKNLSLKRLLGGVLAGILLSVPTACAAAPAEPAAMQSPSTMDLTGLQEHFAKIADRVTPSIVAISAVGADLSPSALLVGPVDGPQLATALDRVSRTVGTGFIIDADGYILTADHVVSDAEQLWITTDDQKVYPAMVVGSDPRSDLAVLKIAAHGLKPVKFAPPASLKRGQWALTLGNPYGLATGGEMAMSVGVVSATNRSLNRLSAQENRLYTNLIQTTAEINPGNSGGPLFDLEGRVIGVNAAVVLPQKNTNGIGFAFAVNDELLRKVAHMKAGEPVQHAYLGVSVSNATAGNTSGAHIDSVLADGPSASAGLSVGDVVTRINGQAIVSSDDFARTVAGLPVSRVAKLDLVRSGQCRTVSVSPDLRPVGRTAVSVGNQRLYWGGMVLTSGEGGYAVKSIAATSPLKRQGIAPGMIITGVDGKRARSLVELLDLLSGTNIEACTLDRAEAAPADRVIAAKRSRQKEYGAA